MNIPEQLTPDQYADLASVTLASAGPAAERLQKYLVLAVLRSQMLEGIELGQRLDAMKKHLFYGRELPQMFGSLTVEDSYKAEKALQDHDIVDMLHMALGQATEAFERFELLYAHIFEGKPMDWINAGEEAGDTGWYLGNESKIIARHVPGLALNEIFRRNILKLYKRYGDKFSEHCARNRDLAAERRVLEGEASI